jgi:hypothetical protein
MAIAIFPGHGFHLFEKTHKHPAQPVLPARLSPRARLERDRPGGRTRRRLTNIGVYLVGTLLSAAVGPMIFALGDRDTALSWAAGLLGL